LQWVFYYLASSNPSIQQRIRDEIKQVCGDGPIDVAALGKLPYLKACVKEAMRLRPIASPNIRVLGKDVELGGYVIPKGTEIQMSTYTTSLDPTIFENPEEFIPERWLVKEDVEKRNLEKHGFASLPFGFGPRMCAGRRLAETEMYLLVGDVIRACRLEFDAAKGVPEPELRLVMVPDRDIYIHFHPLK
jgi:cytochrome P450